jgi:hypothetical protein
MYKDICDNIDYISNLYEKSFQKNILSDIKAYFKNKLDKNLKNDREHLKYCKLDAKLSDNAFN